MKSIYMILILLMIGSAMAAYTYVENANSYAQAGGVIDYAYGVDGLWDSNYAQCGEGSYCWIYMNYTKTQQTANVIMQFTQSDMSGAVNVTVPPGCANKYSNVIMLAWESDQQSLFTSYVSCFNGTWIKMIDAYSYLSFSLGEEGIYIEYPAPPCTPNWSCSSFSSCNASNIVPCTAVTDEQSCGDPFSGSLSTYDDSCVFVVPPGPSAQGAQASFQSFVEQARETTVTPTTTGMTDQQKGFAFIIGILVVGYMFIKPR